MGRRKITIKQITDPKLRHITFNKRKNGLIKKAAELSLLCNINMLLVFEDDTGNLIQFSKNKITNVNSFFQECKFTNIVELTAKEYPHFFKVNHYKKGKDHDEKSSEDDEDDDLDVVNQQELFTYSLADQKQELTKALMKAPKQKEVHLKKENIQQIPNQSSLYLPQQKMELQGLPDAERNAFPPENVMKQEALINGKSNKIKSNVKPAMGRPEEVPKQSKPSMNDNNVMKTSIPPNDINEPMNFRWSQLQNHEDQLRQVTEKNNMSNLGNHNTINTLDYNPSSFKAPGVDPIKRLNGVTDPTMNSPFRFYPNGRLNPNFNNYAAAFGPFSNDEALNSMLKNYQFTFPMATNGPFMTKPSNSGDIDDKFLEAKVLGYFNHPNQAPLNRSTNLFHFPSDYTKMSGNPDAMRQPPNRNDQEFHNSYAEESHEENPMFKPDSRFENNLPSANANSRRIGYEGYYGGGYEEDFGGDVKKKFKHN